jgi:hypothetical protein
MSFDLSGVTGSADVINTTASVTDLSLLYYNDSSFIYLYIPVGYSSLFTSFTLRRGSGASDYKQATATTQGDGTAFSDGWNFLKFDWKTATTVGSPDNTLNTYRRFGITYTSGTAVAGCLLDSWTNALGTLYEMEYYSEYLFRSSSGTWKSVPTDDTDLINIGMTSYEIFFAELMKEITQIIRVGSVLATQLAMWDVVLDGKSSNRYTPDPKDLGLYTNYGRMYPSSAIQTSTRLYNYDV